MGVTELATALDLSKSSVHKHLKTMEEHGYVINNSGRYQLGFKLLTHGGHIRDRNTLCQYVRPTVYELANESNQLVYFILRDGNHGIFVFIENDHYGLQRPIPLGNRYPIHQNAAGKAILAKLPDETIDEIIEETGLPGETATTITDPAKLWEQLETIREQGYSTSMGERIEDVQSIAVAVESPDTDQIGAIGITGSIDHLSQDSIHAKYVNELMEAVNELELRMQYTK